MAHVGFPILGWSAEINRVAFSAFGKDFYWYGIIIGVAFLVGVCYALWRAKSIDFNTDKLIDIILICTPLAIVGARAYYVILSLDQYDTFAEMIAIWDGGVAIYGALIVAVLTAAIACKYKKVSIWDVLDIVSPALMIAQAIGRWGNFVNVEAYGSQTDLPWKMEIYDGSSLINVHPTFLYESLWNVLGFILINLYFKKRKFKGEVFWIYLGWYGIGRAVIEGLRTDSLYFENVRASQIVGILCFVAAIIVISVMRKRIKETAMGDTYESMFASDVMNDGTQTAELKNEAAEEEADITHLADELASSVKTIENDKSADNKKESKSVQPLEKIENLENADNSEENEEK